MFNLSYDEILNIIQEKSGLSRQEIENKIKEKVETLSGLVSKEGAAHIVANELGIQLISAPLTSEKLDIKNIIEGLRNVHIIGKVIRKFETKTFERRDASVGKLGALILADESGKIRVVFWNDNIDTFEKIKEGDILEIKNAYARKNRVTNSLELQTNANTIIIINPEGVEVNVNYDFSEPEKKEIKDLNETDSNVELTATIVSVFDIHFFEVCPICNKRLKVLEDKYICDEHGEVEPKYRCVLNLILDDSTDTIRAVFFNNQIKRLLNINDVELIKLRDNPEEFSRFKDELLGKIIKVVGRVNKNDMFDRLEFIVNLVDPNPEPDLDVEETNLNSNSLDEFK